MDKPLPLTCDNCTKITLPKLADSISIEMLIEGTVQTIDIYNIEISICNTCHLVLFSTKACEIIQAATEEFINKMKKGV